MSILVSGFKRGMCGRLAPRGELEQWRERRLVRRQSEQRSDEREHEHRLSLRAADLIEHEGCRFSREAAMWIKSRHLTAPLG